MYRLAVLLHEKAHLNLVAAGVIVRLERGLRRCAASAAFRRQALPELRGGVASHG
jgi:hypothetical protein